MCPCENRKWKKMLWNEYAHAIAIHISIREDFFNRALLNIESKEEEEEKK